MILAAVLAAVSATVCGAADRLPSGIRAEAGGSVVELSFYTPSSLRVVRYPSGVHAGQPSPSYSITASADTAVCHTVRESADAIVLKSERLQARLDKKSGQLTFYDGRGRRLTSENGTSFLPVKDGPDSAWRVTQSFQLDRDEPIYGLGNYENGQLSQRGFCRTLQPGNVEDGIPVVQSVKGYGILWDNYSPTDFSDTPSGMSFSSSAGDCMDYYFMNGGSADGVIGEIRALTGSVPMFPLWTYGFWQSRERYKSQSELMEVVRRHRELGVPIDGIIQDWQYWGNNYLWNAMEFMSPDFRDPQMMVDSIHAMNAHAIISIWSSFGPQTKPYRELDAKGLLFDFSTWPESGIAEQWPPRRDYPSGVRVYNAYSPEARDIYWNNLRRLYDFGIDGWWMDSTEPDHFNPTEKDMDTPTGLGTFRRVRGAYPLMTVGGVYDHQRALSDSKRVFILTRSGWTGQQRYGCNVWSGDVNSTWEMLRNTVPALLNFTLTGNPNCNSDIGGFFCSGYNTAYGDNSAPRNPLYQELYVRWLQMGTFNPMMRSHGTDIEREIYNFGSAGEPVYDAIAEAIRLRYRLLPYIYSTAWMVTDGDYSFMRPLMMDFPADRRGWDNREQFMFGPALLVAPVLHAAYTPEQVMKSDENTGWNRDETGLSASTSAGPVDFLAPRQTEVYLPASAVWYGFEGGNPVKGGRTIIADVNLKTIPLYVRGGSIIPIGPDVQYASEKPWDSIEIRVYPGADGEFTLYEDEGDGYNYEKGMHSTITFRWDDRRRGLTVDDRKGEYPGMILSRTFAVRDMSRPDASPVTIEYEGKAVTATL